ncbi:MAG: response regulator [Mogibacterium sp.]|nr:response regulator [Mogibacterium sp.]
MIIRLKLQLAEEADVYEIQEVTEQEESVDFTGMHLLLVEDNAINMEIAAMILEQMGFEVDTAENGRIAVDKVSASSPGTYDLILMDIQMPVLDGYDATKEIRSLQDSRLSGIPVIAMTANAFAEDIRAAEEAGMDGHIAKPIDIAVMKNTISDVLSRQRHNTV